MGKSGYHHKNLKAEMIRESIRIIGKEGYGNFSMRKLARACGVSHAAPYRHYKDKESLLTAIFEQLNEKFDRILCNALKKHPDDPEKQLREMAFAYIRFFVENPEYMKFLFFSDLSKTLHSPNDSENMLESSQPYQTFTGAIERYLQSGAKEPDALPADRESLILSLWGLAQGMSVLITQGDFRFKGDILPLVHKIVWNDIRLL